MGFHRSVDPKKFMPVANVASLGPLTFGWLVGYQRPGPLKR